MYYLNLKLEKVNIILSGSKKTSNMCEVFISWYGLSGRYWLLCSGVILLVIWLVILSNYKETYFCV